MSLKIIIYGVLVGIYGVVTAPIYGQSFISRDTVFTPIGYPDGDLSGILFTPIAGNGCAIVAVHELGTDKATMQIWCDTLASHGYTVLSIDYPDPVNQQARFPSPVRAVKTAVQFLRHAGASLQLNGSICALGRSLGAAIVAESMVDERNFSFFGIDSIVSDHIDCAVLLYGLYDYSHFLKSTFPYPLSTFIQQYFQGNTNLQKRETPVLAASRISAPILLIHGTSDQVLQWEQSNSFRDSLSANGKSVNYIPIALAPHLFETTSDDARFTNIGLPIKDSVLQFLNRALSKNIVTQKKFLSLSEITLAPNPSYGSFSITVSSANGSAIEIIDILGRVVRSVPVQHNETTYSITNLPAGMYYCRYKHKLSKIVVLE